MKEFDLDAAKRGAAVCTRDGKKTRIICFDADSPYSICALYRVYKDRENVAMYSLCGEFDVSAPGALDLMMRDDDYLEKLERGEYQSGQIRPLYENPSNSMGLTKREWFAGMAMQGIFSGRNWRSGEMIPDCIGFAQNAVEIADDLIAELEETEK